MTCRELPLVALVQGRELAVGGLDGAHPLRTQEKRHVQVQRVGNLHEHLGAGLRLAALVLRDRRGTHVDLGGKVTLGPLGAATGLLDTGACDGHDDGRTG